MRVLMFSRSSRDVEAVEHALAGGGHSLDIVESADDVITKVSHASYDVVLLEWRSLHPEGTLVQHLRIEAKRPTIIAIVEDVTPRTIGGALDAGVDDVQRRPIVGCELEHRMRARQIDTTIAPPRPEPEVDSLFAWASIDHLARTELGAMLGVKLESVAVDPSRAWAFAAEIPVVHATGGSTVRFSIGIAKSAIPRLAALTLGEGMLDEDTARDLVRETANTIGGAFQRAAYDEGASVTIGLPRDITEEPVADEACARVFGMKSACGISIVVRVELLSDRVENVSPMALREGMVLTRDIFSINGGLLVAGGTRITEVVAGRLSRILPNHTLVQVSFAA